MLKKLPLNPTSPTDDRARFQLTSRFYRLTKLAAAIVASILLPGLFQAAQAAAHFQMLKAFGFPAQLGSQPNSPLLKGSDGILYGTTYGAANNFAGTVFKA